MRSWSKRGWMLVCCLTVAVLGASTALAAGLHWSIQSGTTTGLHNAQLVGVSCGSARSCFAVGVSPVNSTLFSAVVERWRGKRWALQRTPVPGGAKSVELFDVSCPSITRCTATGRSTNSSKVGSALAERWNGSKWVIQRTRNTAGASRTTLRGVDCPSNNWCMAVGAAKLRNAGGFRTLAERWNGRSWSLLKTRNPGSGPFGSELITVACGSTRACVAVGDLVNTAGHSIALAEHWNGKGWTSQLPPLPAGALVSKLVGVSCSGPTSCEAVGYYVTSATSGYRGFADSWDGRSWKLQTFPAPAGAIQTLPIDVSCVAATDCTAVGEAINGHGTEVTLAAKLNGTVWEVQPTPKPRGASISLFNAASCTSRASCVAVGASGSSTRQLPLAERYS